MRHLFFDVLRKEMIRDSRYGIQNNVSTSMIYFEYLELAVHSFNPAVSELLKGKNRLIEKEALVTNQSVNQTGYSS